MLEPPNLQDEKIIACLRDDYELPVVQIAFLPLGADLNTAVYRATSRDTSYFVKLRRGVFDETSVALPKFLRDQGIAQIIAPLPTAAGQLWASLDAFKVILYPFVEGRNGREVSLTARHWREFGRALKRLHTVAMPPALVSRIQRETYSPQWRASLKACMERLEREDCGEAIADAVARDLAAFLKTKRGEVLDLVERTDRLALALQARSPDYVVCHSDVHASNVLIDADGALYIVDWDAPILAPKERDLMFPGGAQGFAGHTPEEEETLFYQGYGQTQINPAALAYYRYERIIEDLAVECDHILSTDQGQDRERSLVFLKSNFLPNNVIEIAYQSDRTPRER